MQSVTKQHLSLSVNLVAILRLNCVEINFVKQDLKVVFAYSKCHTMSDGSEIVICEVGIE
jgi:hypothetical protein